MVEPNKHFKYSIREDWYGILIDPPIHFEIKTTTANHLSLSATLPWQPQNDIPASYGRYTEGLWRYDVCELFLSCQDESYFEFNFSPTGAWWLMRFTAYRQQDPSFAHSRHEKPILAVSKTENSWCVTSTINLASLTASTIKAINCAAIQYSKTTRYFSLNASKAFEPDFHHLNTYKKI